LAQLLLPTIVAIAKEQPQCKILEKPKQTKKENELDKGANEGVELYIVDSNATKKYQNCRGCQHTLEQMNKE
jgi:hypothetical protein